MAINNPLIPGDPYSYDLKWIVDKLQEAIALYQPLNEKFDALSDDFDDLKTFVTDYFANLDISEEVKNKINDMIASGFFDVLVRQIISDSGEVQTTVTNWLNENVTPVGSAVTVDESLTISGAAADAKVVGDRFAEMSDGNYLDYIEKINVICGDFVTGYYVAYDTGVKSANATFGYYSRVPVKGGQYYNCKSVENHIAFFTEDGTYISGVLNTSRSFMAPANAAYLTYSIKIAQNVDQWIIRSSADPLTYTDNKYGYLSQEIALKLDHLQKYFRVGRNLFNRHDLINGASFNYENGLGYDRGLTSYSFTPKFVPCKPNTRYTWNLACIIAEYDENEQTINVYNYTTPTSPRYIITSANAKYLRFSMPTNQVNRYICVEGTDVTFYEEFAVTERYPSRVLTVKKDGTGDYTTISEAVFNAPAGAPIYVYEGVYQESVKELYKPVWLIGSGKNCVIEYSGLDYNNPPLAISRGRVENMVIRATNSGTAGARKAYCMHADFPGEIDGALTFVNVTFINEVHQAVGIGLRRDFTLTFKDCHFESIANNAFYAHDWETDETDRANQKMILDNCTFKTPSAYTPILLQSQELETNVASVLFKNCKAIGGAGQIIDMALWQGRTLTNSSYLGSSDWVLDEFSFNNYNDILNY